jgi:hypothetical protein
LPPPTLHNRTYSIHLTTNDVRPPCGRVPTSQDARLQDHERLGHISFKRMRQLYIDGITPPTSKRLKPITCPVCITAKARRANRPEPSTLFLPASQTVVGRLLPTVQLNHGRMSTQIFPARYAQRASRVRSLRRQPIRSNHVEFLTSKTHFIFGYKRFISYLGRHPKTLRSDEGTEISSLLRIFNHTHHVVGSKDEDF